MSIMNAMNSGVSGLSAEGDALGIVGDNVANSSTVGFKQSRAVFEDVLGGAVGAEPSVGNGVRLARSQQIFAQGSLQNTGLATDIALSGDGFFVVQGTVDGVTGNFFTRAGQSTLRNDGTLVSAQGLALQGYAAKGDGTFESTLGPMVVPTAALSPKVTSTISVTSNFDATSTVPTAAWDPQNPSTTSNFSTTIRTYDSLGTAHDVDIHFRKTGNGTWEYHALAAGSEVQGGTGGQSTEVGTGTLTFTTAGALQATTGSIQVDFVGATAGQTVALDFGKTIAQGGSGFGGSSQFGAPSNVTAQSQDGYSSGDFSQLKIESDGTVAGVYTNGQRVDIGKLAVAKFRSNDGLARTGHNMWVETSASGEPAIGEAASGGRGGVVAGALEQSNVDIAAQFVELIARQRSFQANSKTITTANEMLQEVTNLKR
ncbi:MAG: flagellar hook protein FlgE [Polyangiaceae bacterium]